LWFPVSRSGQIGINIYEGDVLVETEIAYSTAFFFRDRTGQIHPSITLMLGLGKLSCAPGHVGTDVDRAAGCDECSDCKGDPDAETPIPPSPTPRRVRANLKEVSVLRKRYATPETRQVGNYLELDSDFHLGKYCLCWDGTCGWLYKEVVKWKG